MRRILLSITVFVVSFSSIAAQSTSAEFRSRYESLVKRVGASGIGVETLLNRWEDGFPDDADMLEAKFTYYFQKSQSSQVVQKSADKFMGQKPLLALKDSSGMDINYFQETFYDDSLFALSSQAIDKAIRLYPDRIDLRFDKVTALTAFEKESPDMAASALAGLIDYNASAHPVWKVGENEIDEDTFFAAMQEYCFAFYTIGSAVSYEAFRSLSERMLRFYPKNTIFLTNMGTYWLIARKDSKQALKYYNKVLKIKPDDYTAIKNCVLLSRNDKNVKLEKKYLPLLIKYTEDELEKQSAQARLEYLGK